MFRSISVLWLVVVAACCLVCPAVESSSEIESSISTGSTGHPMPGSLRFYGVTKTMKTTTTVVHLYTRYVHQTCLMVTFGTAECQQTTPPPPTTTTTTTTTPTPVTVTPGTTSAPVPTTTQPAFQVVTGQFKPSVWTNITVNKLSPPNLNLLPPLPVIGSGLAGLFNKPAPINIKVSANATASISPGNGRRRRSEILLEKIRPSLVRSVEMTASPDLSLGESIKQDVAVEASRAEESQQYQIAGLMAHHFAERALPLILGSSSNPITIVRLDPVTVTVSQTVTSKFPFDKPSDRVTLAYAGCVPSDVVAMNLPHCV